jgi:8-oxo-dGTP pyrophosphatase MutT (NUDIX family)
MRGASVETYPSCLHTLGGAYIPAGFAGVDADRKGLRATVVREVHEEAQLALAGEATPPMMFSQELSTGFVQLVFLGFSAEAGALEQVLGNWEGDPQLIPYDQLPAILLDEPNWVPSGRAHVLAWLALGAPNAGARPRFATMSPRQLFSAAVSASA